MSELVKKIRYLNNKAKYFQKLKDDEKFLYEEIEKISIDNVKYVQNLYINEDKIKKIRYEVGNLLLNRKFNKENFENLKQKINNQYDTNILQTWKDFSILYVFFFNPIKNIVNEYLEDIGNYFIENSGKKLKLKTTNFDGTRNLGDVGCWIALYNPKYNSQSDGIQYFMNFYDNNTTYGTYHHETKKDIDRKEYDIENLDENTIQSIIIDLRNQLNTILENENAGKDYMTNEKKQTQPLNQILYGSPGTGKTYNTINKALEIIDSDFYKENRDNREALKEKFEEYKKSGQIEFITFHQSYGYEEFVEGIKAISPDDERNPTDNLIYKVEAGIFKKLCENAENKEYVIDDLSIDDNSSIWKISLGSTYGNEIKTKCLNDNEIRIGWTNVKEVGDDNFNKLGSNNQSTIRNFIEDMKIGDLVISIYNQNKIDGIGIIESEYKSDDDEHYNKFRKVKWLSKDILDLTQLNGNKVFVQKTVYKINRFKPKDLLSLIKQNEIQVKSDNINKNYILIIDEINRGNISKIFGELITLIEPSKRIGADEEIRVKLPYSGDSEEPFGVPKNLYIIGTMNTADRSIAPIDTALRRRFVFEEMAPDSSLLSKERTPDIYDGVNLQSLLEAIITRIEYLYDRDHTMGHAY